MKELKTKKGVFLTTYTLAEMDEEISCYMDSNDSDGCKLFLSKLRSFNPESDKYITTEEAIEITGIEIKANKKNPDALYTNYNGAPFGLSISGNVKLLFKDPILSLKSAFKATTPEFDFVKDLFHIIILMYIFFLLDFFYNFAKNLKIKL